MALVRSWDIETEDGAFCRGDSTVVLGAVGSARRCRIDRDNQVRAGVVLGEVCLAGRGGCCGCCGLAAGSDAAVGGRRYRTGLGRYFGAASSGSAVNRRCAGTVGRRYDGAGLRGCFGAARGRWQGG